MNEARTPTLDEQVEYLRQLPDDQIDLTDIPEVLDFTHAERGRFYRPVKQTVTLRLDADVVDWFKRSNPKYQTAINKALREYVISRQGA